jgi:hypothetical protein
MNDHFHKPWKNEPRTTETLTRERLAKLKDMTLEDIFQDRISDIRRCAGDGAPSESLSEHEAGNDESRLDSEKQDVPPNPSLHRTPNNGRL